MAAVSFCFYHFVDVDWDLLFDVYRYLLIYEYKFLHYFFFLFFDDLRLAVLLFLDNYRNPRNLRLHLHQLVHHDLGLGAYLWLNHCHCLLPYFLYLHKLCFCNFVCHHHLHWNVDFFYFYLCRLHFDRFFFYLLVDFGHLNHKQLLYFERHDLSAFHHLFNDIVDQNFDWHFFVEGDYLFNRYFNNLFLFNNFLSDSGYFSDFLNSFFNGMENVFDFLHFHNLLLLNYLLDEFFNDLHLGNLNYLLNYLLHYLRNLHYPFNDSGHHYNFNFLDLHLHYFGNLNHLLDYLFNVSFALFYLFVDHWNFHYFVNKAVHNLDVMNISGHWLFHLHQNRLLHYLLLYALHWHYVRHMDFLNHDFSHFDGNPYDPVLDYRHFNPSVDSFDDFDHLGHFNILDNLYFLWNYLLDYLFSHYLDNLHFFNDLSNNHRLFYHFHHLHYFCYDRFHWHYLLDVDWHFLYLL